MSIEIDQDDWYLPIEVLVVDLVSYGRDTWIPVEMKKQRENRQGRGVGRGLRFFR